MSIDSASVSAAVDNMEVESTGLFEIIETKNQENTMMSHHGEWGELYSYKDPVSPKCSPDGPLTEPWSPGSPSSSSLPEQILEESEDSAIEEVDHIKLLFMSFLCLDSVQVLPIPCPDPAPDPAPDSAQTFFVSLLPTKAQVERSLVILYIKTRCAY